MRVAAKKKIIKTTNTHTHTELGFHEVSHYNELKCCVLVN